MTTKEQVKDLVTEADFVNRNYPMPPLESIREWQAAQTIGDAMQLIEEAIEHIEDYDDGMAGWLDKARDFLA